MGNAALAASHFVREARCKMKTRSSLLPVISGKSVPEAAKELRDRHETCRLKSFVKTSGRNARRGSGRAAGPLGPSKIVRRLGRAGDGERPARALCRHHCEACPTLTHFYRLFMQRPRYDSGDRVFVLRIAASIRLDASRLGRTLGRLALRPLRRREPSPPARIFEAGSSARFFQNSPGDSD